MFTKTVAETSVCADVPAPQSKHKVRKHDYA